MAVAAVPRFVAIAAVLFAQPVLAQSIPASGDATMAICTGFLAQGAGSMSGDKTKLCNCLIRETGTKLSTEEMMAYAQASMNSQTPPPAVLDKVMNIATTCLQEAQ